MTKLTGPATLGLFRRLRVESLPVGSLTGDQTAARGRIRSLSATHDLSRPTAGHHLEKFMKIKNNKALYLSSRGRRQFLRKGAGSMAGAWLSAWPWHELMAQQDLNPTEENWDAGIVRHLLPAVNHSTFLIKASFNRPL